MSYVFLSGLKGFGAFGSADFDAPNVWLDWKSDNAARQNAAAKVIQRALNTLGYGNLTVDGQFGSGSLSAYCAFLAANGMPGRNACWPDQVGIIKLGELIDAAAAGKPAPGAGKPVESHVVGGQVIPGPAPKPPKKRPPTSKPQQPGAVAAGLSTGTMIGVAALGLVGLGALAVIAKKKKPTARPGAQAA